MNLVGLVSPPFLSSFQQADLTTSPSCAIVIAGGHMDSFYKYVGVRGVLAVVVTIAVVAAVFMKYEIDAPMWSLLGLAWGAYFPTNGNSAVKALTAPK